MIGAVENAIIAALKAAADGGTLGYAWGTLETYPEDFDSYLKEKKGLLRFPAAWAVFLSLGDGQDDGDDAGWHGEARFALVVAAKNLRNETATRHGGSGAEPGSYQLAIDATRILSRNALKAQLDPADAGLPGLVSAITVTGMRLVALTPEMRTQGLSLMAVELRCRIPFGNFDGEGTPGAFRIFHADWDIPPIGDVTAPLPASTPDAEDLVELPQ